MGLHAEGCSSSSLSNELRKGQRRPGQGKLPMTASFRGQAHYAMNPFPPWVSNRGTAIHTLYVHAPYHYIQ